jgi:hypothetical protein
VSIVPDSTLEQPVFDQHNITRQPCVDVGSDWDIKHSVAGQCEIEVDGADGRWTVGSDVSEHCVLGTEHKGIHLQSVDGQWLVLVLGCGLGGGSGSGSHCTQPAIGQLLRAGKVGKCDGHTSGGCR